MASRDFEFRIIGDSTKGNAALDDFGNKLKRTFDEGKTNASVFKGALGGSFLGNIFGSAVGKATDVAAEFFSGSRQQASDLNETVSKSQTIFGDYFAGIDKWTDRSAETLGLSKSAALDAATGFGNMFSQLGFVGQQAADMSRAVVQTSADLGSFNNLETGDVADRMAAAFRGEYDSLQALIPNINAARVEQEAMAATGKTNAAELTAQEKATAVLAIVQKDGAAAMGDFAKTAEGAANKSKTATAALEDQQAALGQKLLPIYTQFQSFLITHLVPAISTVIQFVTDNQTVFTILAIGVGIVIAAVIAMNVALWLLAANPIVLLIGLIVIAIVALVIAIVWLISNWDAVVQWGMTVWAGFVGWLTGVILGFVGWWNGIWTAVGSFISTVWNNIVNWVTGYVNFLILGVQIGLQLISNTWNNVWNGLGGIVRGIWNGILGFIESGVNGAIGLINKMITGVNDVGGAFGISIALIPRVSIPRLATGGLTSGPMLSIIGDNAGGKELVSPLDRAQQHMTDTTLAAVAAALSRSSGPSSSKSSSRLHPDDIKALGRELAAALYPAIRTGAAGMIKDSL